MRNPPLKIIFIYAMAIITRIIAWLSVGMLLIFLLPLVIPYIKDASSYSYITTALSVQHKIEIFIKSIIPTIIGGKDRVTWIGAGGGFLLNMIFSPLAEQYKSMAIYLRMKLQYEEIKTKLNIPENSSLLSPLRDKLEQASGGNKKDRQELLMIFAETKKKLDQIGKDLAFLSIDVVDSTGMKLGEDRAAVEHSFIEYKNFVESMFILHGYYKAAWTPDGVMACFRTVDDAVQAARDIMTGLDDFNKHQKTMKRDFIVRCGINSGFVYIDDDTPLEQVSDRVIDIAGHMQKHAQPSTVAIAKSAVEPLSIKTGFEAAGRQVDGYEVYEWKKI